MLAFLTILACDTVDDVPLAPSSVDTSGGTWNLVLSPSPDPHAAGEVALSIDILSNDTGDYAPEASITALTPWMPDHNHGISDEPVIINHGDGTAEASWTYSMSGYWELTITVDDSEEATVGYEVK